MLRRRIATLTLLGVITIVLYGLAPLLLLTSVILSIAPRLRTLPHALLFALGFLFYECIGVLRLFWVWLRYRNAPTYSGHNQHIQYWWAGGLLRIGTRIFGLTFSITGERAIKGPTALFIARHTSIADTVLPMLYFAEHRKEGMRYILKQELTAMPCLDIAGHRLPNLFVDRSGIDTEGELQAVQELTQQASNRESVLVYPEGTRFTTAKHKQLQANKPELRTQLSRWPGLLPPRLGGVSAMLAANPGKDVVFLAHTGFEGSASLTDLMNGSWRKQVVRLHFWRVPYENIPSDHTEFIFTQWDEMQRRVTQMAATASDQ